MSALDPHDLRAILDGDVAGNVLTLLWAARTYEDLGYAARVGLSTVGVWAEPSSVRATNEYGRARLSLISYVLGSTLNLRTREFYDLQVVSFSCEPGA
jgi:hypothetical protein